MKKITIAFLSIIVLQSCNINMSTHQGIAFEKHTSLEKTDFKKSDLDNFSKYLEQNSKTTGMLVLYDGKIVYEYGNIEEVSYIASCRKSVLSILYGKYVENETIDLKQTIGDIGIDEKDGLLAKEKNATVNDIITSRSGVFHIPANGGYDEKNILERGSVNPGEYFVYNNWDFNVAGYILEKKTGHSVYQEIEEQLAIPLGFQDWNINNQKKKHNKNKSQYPAYHIYISTRDMAKIGQLMLNEGLWEGKQIVPKDWIKKITTTITPVDIVNERRGLNSSSAFQFSYGYMWWLMKNFKNHPDFEGAYTASGNGGQFITVIPKRKIVIAHKTKLSLLTRWGIAKGGISDWQYWTIIYKLLTNKKDISDLINQENTITKIVDFIKKEDNLTSQYDVSESGINAFGYQLMNKEKLKESLAIFELNTLLYPNSYNAFDSYAECLLKLGRKNESIKAYQKVIELNPKNKNAKEIILKLERVK